MCFDTEYSKKLNESTEYNRNIVKRTKDMITATHKLKIKLKEGIYFWKNQITCNEISCFVFGVCNDQHDCGGYCCDKPDAQGNLILIFSFLIYFYL